MAKAIAKKNPKGPVPRADGLKGKLFWAEKNLSKKGLTRAQAIGKLQKQFPEMSDSYARSFIYSRCSHLEFKDVRNIDRGGTKKAPTKTNTSKKPSKEIPPAKTKKGAKPSKKKEEAPEDDLGIDLGV